MAVKKDEGSNTTKVTGKKPTTKKVVPNKEEKIKYRCDFESYEEYNKYTGKKG